LKLEFRDNGIGFEYDGKQSGNGLNNMQKRAEQIGGELEISSSPNNGTIITFLGEIS
jgi:signal transduction histidine kinase